MTTMLTKEKEVERCPRNDAIPRVPYVERRNLLDIVASFRYLHALNFSCCRISLVTAHDGYDSEENSRNQVSIISCG